MTTLELSIFRLKSLIFEIDRLSEDGDFAYSNSLKALIEIRVVLNNHLLLLESFTIAHNPATVLMNCTLSLTLIHQFVGYLGLILRSTDVRNSFEVYSPLLRMARAFLGKNITFVLSSEWDFSPFVIKMNSLIKDVVMIGLPAPESENPLLLPLAGHELAHSIWARNSTIPNPVVQFVQDEIVNQINANPVNSITLGIPPGIDPRHPSVASRWSEAFRLAINQAQETFCDFFGLKLFGESFAYSSMYILSPSIACFRAPSYPNLVQRALNLKSAAANFGTSLPTNFESLFENQQEQVLPAAGNLIQLLADNASTAAVPTLITSVNDLIATGILSGGIVLPSNDGKNRVLASLKEAVPPQNPACLADIINAGWTAKNSPDFWSHIPQISKEKSTPFLYDLLLKSIEVLEVRHKLMEP